MIQMGIGSTYPHNRINTCMRLQKFLTEKYWDTMENRWGKTEKSPTGFNDIFMNPESKEIREIQSDGEFAILVVDSKRVLAFSVWVLHADVIDFVDANRRDVVTANVTLKGRNMKLIISGTMKGSKWYHKRDVEDYLQENKWLKKYNLTIDYWDGESNWKRDYKNT